PQHLNVFIARASRGDCGSKRLAGLVVIVDLPGRSTEQLVTHGDGDAANRNDGPDGRSQSHRYRVAVFDGSFQRAEVLIRGAGSDQHAVAQLHSGVLPQVRTSGERPAVGFNELTHVNLSL